MFKKKDFNVFFIIHCSNIDKFSLKNDFWKTGYQLQNKLINYEFSWKNMCTPGYRVCSHVFIFQFSICKSKILAAWKTFYFPEFPPNSPKPSPKSGLGPSSSNFFSEMLLVGSHLLCIHFSAFWHHLLKFFSKMLLVGSHLLCIHFSAFYLQK